MDDYVVVGALARIETDSRQEVYQRIEALAGFTAFEVEDPLKLGILIEARSVDEAHSLFSTQLTKVEGILGAWPVSVDWDEGVECGPQCEQKRDTVMAAPDSAIHQPGNDLPETMTGNPHTKSEANR